MSQLYTKGLKAHELSLYKKNDLNSKQKQLFDKYVDGPLSQSRYQDLIDLITNGVTEDEIGGKVSQWVGEDLDNPDEEWSIVGKKKEKPQKPEKKTNRNDKSNKSERNNGRNNRNNDKNNNRNNNPNKNINHNENTPSNIANNVITNNENNKIADNQNTEKINNESNNEPKTENGNNENENNAEKSTINKELKNSDKFGRFNDRNRFDKGARKFDSYRNNYDNNFDGRNYNYRNNNRNNNNDNNRNNNYDNNRNNYDNNYYYDRNMYDRNNGRNGGSRYNNRNNNLSKSMNISNPTDITNNLNNNDMNRNNNNTSINKSTSTAMYNRNNQNKLNSNNNNNYSNNNNNNMNQNNSNTNNANSNINNNNYNNNIDHNKKSKANTQESKVSESAKFWSHFPKANVTVPLPIPALPSLPPPPSFPSLPISKPIQSTPAPSINEPINEPVEINQTPSPPNQDIQIVDEPEIVKEVEIKDIAPEEVLIPEVVEEEIPPIPNIQFATNESLLGQNVISNLSTPTKELSISNLQSIDINEIPQSKQRTLYQYSIDDISITNDTTERSPPTTTVNLGKYKLNKLPNMRFAYIQSSTSSTSTNQQPQLQSMQPIQQIPVVPIVAYQTQVPQSVQNSNEQHHKPDQKVRSSQEVEKEILQDNFPRDPNVDNRNQNLHYYQPMKDLQQRPAAPYLYYVPPPDNRRYDSQIQPTPDNTVYQYFCPIPPPSFPPYYLNFPPIDANSSMPPRPDLYPHYNSMQNPHQGHN